MDKKPIIGNAPSQEQPKEDPMTILHHINVYSHTLMCATSRKQRNEQLMSRKSAKAWTPAKKAKMVRRLMTTNQEITQSENALDQLKIHLERLMAEAAQQSKFSGLVPVATSI